MGVVGEGCAEALVIESGLKKWVGVYHEERAVEGKVLAELAGPVSMVSLEGLEMKTEKWLSKLLSNTENPVSQFIFQS